MDARAGRLARQVQRKAQRDSQLKVTSLGVSCLYLLRYSVIITALLSPPLQGTA